MISLLILLLATSLQIKKEHLIEWTRAGSYRASLQNAILETTLPRRNPREPFRVATIHDGITHPAFVQALGFETVDGYLSLYPKAYQRFWGKVIEPLTSQDEVARRYFHDWGCRIYLFSPRQPQKEILVDRFYRINLLSLANAKYLISRTPLIHEALVPIHPKKDGGKERGGAAGLWERVRENFTGRRSLHVYENIACLPRFYPVKQKIFFEEEEELLQGMALCPVERLGETVFLEEKERGRFGPEERSYKHFRMQIEEYSPDRIELDLEIDGGAVLVTSNTYSPFWKCRVDGSPRELFRANGAFWGVQVREGDRRILFYYDPPYRISSGPVQLS